MPNVHVSIAYQSDIGVVRDTNEDALLVTDFTSFSRGDRPPAVYRLDVGPRGVLLLVSDGMGGEKAGEVASALVVEEVARTMESASPDVPGDALLKDAVARAHAAVLVAAQDAAHAGMGATLTAVHVRGGMAHVAEVGDSRAYVIRAGRILQLTKDQNLAQLMVDAGSLKVEEAAGSFMSSVLAQSMGHHTTVRPALGRLELRHRDCLLLCSDGLTRAVTDKEVLDTVLGAKSLDAACSALVKLANERGGEDNVTVVLAGFGGDLPEVAPGDRLSASYEILESFAPATSARPASPKPRPLVPASVKFVR